MSQKIINVGTVANDGTGDTIRGAFTNVNANFTEVYSNISTLEATVASIDSGQNAAIEAAQTTANNAYDKANAANLLAYTVGVNANLYSDSVGVAAGAGANVYAATVGAASNSYTNAVGTAGNNYVSILAANNAVGANAWANTVSVTTTDWANSKFTTLTNTSLIFSTANGAFAVANASFANSSGSFAGNLFVTGTLSDSIGPIREKFANTITSNILVQLSRTVIIANNQNMIYINVPDDNNFLLPANVGTTVEIFQYGPGATKITANDGAVTVNSSNNWSNIAGQYLTATLTKIQANTWMLTGNLKQ